MLRVVLVGVGSGLGGILRYGVSLWTPTVLGTTFPWGTLLVNVTGSFLIAVVMELSLGTTLVPSDLRLFLTTGIMGGYTTYSTFNWETMRALQTGAPSVALLNLAATVVGCLGAGAAGVALAKAVA